MMPVYRAAVWPLRTARNWMISRRALAFLPYYQDELSRSILHDRIRYIKIRDNNIFMDITDKAGMKFHGLPYYMGGKEASGIVLLHGRNESKYRYILRVLGALERPGKFRALTLKDFLSGAEISDSELVVSVLTDWEYIRFGKECSSRRIKPKILEGFCLIRDDLQYFDVFSPVDDEIVVDAGAYDGATAIQFLKWGGGKVRHVYSFEFDPDNAAKCRENIRPYSGKVTLVEKGTWDKDKILRINTPGTSGSSVRSKGSTAVYLTTIDSIVKDERVTFIKMDVEGAELKSLMGARNTIIKNHPRLAVCVYHKPTDLCDIPGYILSLVPDYKFFLRHYSSCQFETVLYAYCE